MAHIVMASIGMVYIIMAYTVMASPDPHGVEDL